LVALVSLFSLVLALAGLLLPIRLEALVLRGSYAISFVAISLSVILARRYLDRRSLVSLGLAWDARSLMDLLAGFAVPGVMMGLIYLVEWATGWLSFKGFTWNALPPLNVAWGLLGMLLAFVAVGWSEELLSRGYWLQNLAEGLGTPWGVLLSSGFFAAMHIGNPYFSWQAFLGLLTSGIFLAWGYLRTHRLWLPIGLHTGWNYFEGVIFGFPVSGLDSFRLLRQTVDGPMLLTGGAFGPEAGLMLLPALCLGIILINLYTSNRKPGRGDES
jgi:membrane protease YdiL (CAAX protease family)